MKNLFFFGLILFSVLSFSQTKEMVFVFKDKTSGALIENVIVAILRTDENFQSNKEGVVKFNLNKPSRINIKHTEYKEISLNSVTIKELETVVFLESICHFRRVYLIPFAARAFDTSIGMGVYGGIYKRFTLFIVGFCEKAVNN